MTKRNSILNNAKTFGQGMSQAALEAAKAKLAARKPAKALEQTWYEVVYQQHGRVPGVKWGIVERQLAAKLFASDGQGGDEIELEMAERMVRHFVTVWCPRVTGRFPSFTLFWKVRGQIHGEVTETIKPRMSKDEKLMQGEHKPDKADKYPKIGWG